MPEIHPFAARRPDPARIARVVSRPFEDYSEQERAAVLSCNPDSFLHVLCPEFPGVRTGDRHRHYRAVSDRYREFSEQGKLQKDTLPAFYLYETNHPGYRCRGILCITHTADYSGERIRRHEATIRKREERFADFLEAVRFNAEPVLMTYPDSSDVDRLLDECQSREPDSVFGTPDNESHRIWAVTDAQLVNRIARAYRDIPAFYIADGHHRSASSELLSRRMERKNPTHNGSEPYNFFMSYLVPESMIRIRPFSRFLTDLGGHTPNEVLGQVEKSFVVKSHGDAAILPSARNSFTMYLQDTFYSLQPQHADNAVTIPEGHPDAQLLNDQILGPIFGIEDPRHDDRLAYLCGPDPAGELRAEVDSGRFAVGFGMVPVAMSEIRAVADAGRTMPPKSTFVEPKLRSGLTIYDI